MLSMSSRQQQPGTVLFPKDMCTSLQWHWSGCLYFDVLAWPMRVHFSAQQGETCIAETSLEPVEQYGSLQFLRAPRQAGGPHQHQPCCLGTGLGLASTSPCDDSFPTSHREVLGQENL